MIENRPWLTVFSHAVLIAGIAVIAFPLYITFVASTLTLDQIIQVPMPLVPGDQFWQNYSQVLVSGTQRGAAAPVGRMMFNSLVMALVIAVGKTLPLIASATATFLFRQFFLTVPDELAEAARIDGAGPMRFFKDVLLPLSKTSMAALFVIQFIYGWNQYLLALLITTQESLYTSVIGIKRMIVGGDALTEWHLVTATAMLALLPPALVIVLMQKWFVKGLVETEK